MIVIVRVVRKVTGVESLRVAVGLVRGVKPAVTVEWIHLAMDVLAKLKDNSCIHSSSMVYM